jgi:hypothetical protein
MVQKNDKILEINVAALVGKSVISKMDFTVYGRKNQ